MTIRERAEKNNPYKKGAPAYDVWIEGYEEAVNGEEWKNLYAEGLEVGLKMLRDYEGQLKEKATNYDKIVEEVKVAVSHLTTAEVENGQAAEDIGYEVQSIIEWRQWCKQG